MAIIPSHANIKPTDVSTDTTQTKHNTIPRSHVLDNDDDDDDAEFQNVIILNPSPTDVKPTTIPNSSSSWYNHPGNKVYTNLIKKQKQNFVSAHMQKDTKTQNVIVESIYTRITKMQSPPGRFLTLLKKKNRTNTQQEGYHATTRMGGRSYYYDDDDDYYSILSKEDSLKMIHKALSENNKIIQDYFTTRGLYHSSPSQKDEKHSSSRPAATATAARSTKMTTSWKQQPQEKHLLKSKRRSSTTRCTKTRAREECHQQSQSSSKLEPSTSNLKEREEQPGPLQSPPPSVLPLRTVESSIIHDTSHQQSLVHHVVSAPVPLSSSETLRNNNHMSFDPALPPLLTTTNVNDLKEDHHQPGAPLHFLSSSSSSSPLESTCSSSRSKDSLKTFDPLPPTGLDVEEGESCQETIHLLFPPLSLDNMEKAQPIHYLPSLDLEHVTNDQHQAARQSLSTTPNLEIMQNESKVLQDGARYSSGESDKEVTKIDRRGRREIWMKEKKESFKKILIQKREGFEQLAKKADSLSDLSKCSLKVRGKEKRISRMKNFIRACNLALYLCKKDPDSTSRGLIRVNSICVRKRTV